MMAKLEQTIRDLVELNVYPSTETICKFMGRKTKKLNPREILRRDAEFARLGIQKRNPGGNHRANDARTIRYL